MPRRCGPWQRAARPWRRAVPGSANGCTCGGPKRTSVRGGRGGPDDLLFRACPVAMFDFVDAQALSNGIVVLSYRSTDTATWR